MKNDLRIYNIDDKYVEYLRKFESKVFDPKLVTRNHERKYVGIVLEINNFKYYIPFSSPKASDFEKDSITIRRSIIPIIRMTNKSKSELKGTLKLSNMIPIPDESLRLYEIRNEVDLKYKDLLLEQARFIKDNTELIKKNASIIYKQKCNNYDIGYIKNCCDFKLLEEKCLEYQYSLQTIKEVAVTSDESIHINNEDKQEPKI